MCVLFENLKGIDFEMVSKGLVMKNFDYKECI